MGTNLVFGDSKKRERHTFDGFLLKMTFDVSLKEWMSCERLRRDGGGLQQPKR